MTTIPDSQMPSFTEDCEQQLALYEAIRLQISESFFSRTKIDEDELLHVLFVKLADKVLPPLGSEELVEELQKEIRSTIRDFKRSKRSMFDIDELTLDEEPAYDPEGNREEEEFETMFDRFCDSSEEPERTIYRLFRTYTKKEIANIAGISRNEVARFLKKLPKKFETFVEKFSE